MGQYFKAALIDNEGKVKVVNLNGWKLMEHSWYGNNSMERVEKLLYREARNVYWIGDYSIISAFVWKHKFEDEEDKMWDFKGDRYDERDLLKRNPDLDYFLVNHYSKEIINMTRQEMNKDLWEDEKWKNVVHPLPLLCRAETEEAGGGYHSDISREHIGKWCGDIISIMSGEREEMEKAFKDADIKIGPTFISLKNNKMRINKSELQYLVGDINNWYMKNGMNRYLSMTTSRRYYTPNIIELIGYLNDYSILHRKFRTYREAWHYLIGVKDGLDVL